MADLLAESVEDRDNLLAQEDHMREMDDIALEVVSISRPYPTLARLVGRIASPNPEAWLPANQAVRIKVAEPEGRRAVTRIYTIRSFDPANSTVEIDFVIHDDQSPAMRWLNSARPGSSVGVIGPRQHMVPNVDSGKRAAIFADETAIPAVYAILNDWPAGARASLWIETGEPAAFDELPRLPGLDYHLIHRAPDQHAGETGALFAAARAAITAPDDWTIWAAGERQEMRDFRNHFRKLGLATEDVRVFGYWKHGASSSELDRIRLDEYAALRKEGGKLEDFNDSDLPI